MRMGHASAAGTGEADTAVAQANDSVAEASAD
jgi:hypothetical protein